MYFITLMNDTEPATDRHPISGFLFILIIFTSNLGKTVLVRCFAALALSFANSCECSVFPRVYEELNTVFLNVLCNGKDDVPTG